MRVNGAIVICAALIILRTGIINLWAFLKWVCIHFGGHRF